MQTYLAVQTYWIYTTSWAQWSNDWFWCALQVCNLFLFQCIYQIFVCKLVVISVYSESIPVNRLPIEERPMIHLFLINEEMEMDTLESVSFFQKLLIFDKWKITLDLSITRWLNPSHNLFEFSMGIFSLVLWLFLQVGSVSIGKTNKFHITVVLLNI